MDQPKTWFQDALIPPEPDGHFVMIPLTRGKFAIVDDADVEWIMGFGTWYADKSRHSQTWYACHRSGRGRLYMHAIIAGCKAPDHVNRNGLDNRRVNLRAATGTQNQGNRGLLSNNTSGYKGVRMEDGRWQARIAVNGRTAHLGRFSNLVEAAAAYNAAALEVFGEFAWLNPVPAGFTERFKGATDWLTPNGSGLQRNNTSGYRGVHWNCRDRKWIARIKVDGRKVHLGCFDDPVEAARAFNRAALEVRGEGAWLNLIPDVTEPPAA